MKIIKSILSFITLSVLTAILLFIMLNYQNLHTTDQETKNTNNNYTQPTQKPYTESPVQPIRKTYDEDYALRLMSVPRKNITEITVINDYDKTLSKLQYNVNNNVATFKDKEILRVYYNIQEEKNNGQKTNN